MGMPGGGRQAIRGLPAAATARPPVEKPCSFNRHLDVSISEGYYKTPIKMTNLFFIVDKRFVLHYFRVMKNLTITLAEQKWIPTANFQEIRSIRTQSTNILKFYDFYGN
jgi:hypothetical protein